MIPCPSGAQHYSGIETRRFTLTRATRDSGLGSRRGELLRKRVQACEEIRRLSEVCEKT